MKRLIIFTLALFLFCCIGCQTKPAEVPEDLRPDMKNPQKVGSGRSSAETNTNDMPLNTGVAWGASQNEQTSTTAKYQPTTTTSGTGSLVTGFQLGAISEANQKAREFVTSRLNENPVLKSISEELKYLMDEVKYDESWQVRVDSLRKQMSDVQSELLSDMNAAGMTADVNLAQLTHIVVVGFITSNVGHTERAPSNEEIDAIARVLPNIVAASRGEEVQPEPDKPPEGEVIE